MGSNHSLSKEELKEHEQLQRVRYQQDKLLNPEPVYHFNFGGLACELVRDCNGLESMRTETWLQVIVIPNDHKSYKDDNGIESLKSLLKERSICVHVDDKQQRIYIFQDFSVSYPPGNTESYREKIKNNKTYYVDFLQAKEDLEKLVNKHFYNN